MNRRSFAKYVGLLSGLTSFATLNSFSNMSKPKYKMGYQLFSIRDQMSKDPLTTLKALQEMGYEDFELYGYDDARDEYYGFKSTELRKILDDLNLTFKSGHYGFSPYLLKPVDELRRYVDRCIKGAKRIGSDYITWPWLDPKLRTLENMKLMADRLNVIGEQVTKAGLGFSYHNHGFEFEDHDGKNGYDIIMSGTDPDKVKLQMDMYWVMHSAKITPKALVKKQPGRFVMWHIKDMDTLTRDYTELGNGSINYLQLLPDPDESGLEYYYLEQGGNFTIDSTTSAAASARYCQNNLVESL